ncbi:MAG: hypothetical protein RIQ81_589 [Pseudomonadota bacterium]
MEKALAPLRDRPDVLAWHVTMVAETTLDGKSLVGSGVLDRGRDARLLTLLGEARVKVRTSQIKFETVSEKQIPQIAGEVAARIKKNLLLQSVVDLKKDAIAGQVDACCQFGAAENR